MNTPDGPEQREADRLEQSARIWDELAINESEADCDPSEDLRETLIDIAATRIWDGAL